jgi:hypothetical protein
MDLEVDDDNLVLKKAQVEDGKVQLKQDTVRRYCPHLYVNLNMTNIERSGETG